jgi:multicomponent Na+:H+ antiporter subunit D
MTTAGASQLAPLMIAVPIVAACVLVALGQWLPRRLIDGVATVTAIAVTVLGCVLFAATGDGRVVTWAGGFTPVHGRSVGVALVVDRFGCGLAVLAAVLVSCALVYSWHYFSSVEGHYHCLLLLFLAGMTGFVLSGDVFDMFVFFELMGAVAYALTAFKIEDPSALQGGLNFGIVNSFGAYLTLMGIGLLYARTGQLGLAQLSVALSGHRADALLVAAFVLIATGWLTKAAVVPFHFWTADAEAVAPSPVCAIFSGIMVELGIYGLARVYWVVFSGTLPHDDVRRCLIVFATVTAILGAVMCLLQRDLKRLLAFSTIAHVGLFLFAVALLTPSGLSGAAVYIASNAGVKGALFLLAGLILNRYRTVDEYRLHGRGQGDHRLGVLTIIAGLGLACLPPFGTALGKGIAEEAAAVSGFPWAPVLFVAVSAVTGGAVLRAAARIFYGLGAPAEAPADSEIGDEPDIQDRLEHIPVPMIGAVLVLLVGSFAVGTVPELPRILAAAAARFTDRSGYVAQTLTATAPSAPSADNAVPSGWTVSGTLLGAASAALAVATACAALFRYRLPSPGRRVTEGARKTVSALHTIHSGHIGDYITWMVVGVAGLAVLLTPPLLR